MNIFALSDDPKLAAQWQHDKHVVVMVKETAQLISQAVRLNDNFKRPFISRLGNAHFESLYKVTHRYHPCAKWSRQNASNFKWLCEHGEALSEEYSFRFGRGHKSDYIVQLGLALCHFLDTAVARTPFAQAVPAEFKEDDPVLAYRRYYLAEKVKGDSKWTERRKDLPEWLFVPAVTTFYNNERKKK